MSTSAWASVSPAAGSMRGFAARGSPVSRAPGKRTVSAASIVTRPQTLPSIAYAARQPTFAMSQADSGPAVMYPRLKPTTANAGGERQARVLFEPAGHSRGRQQIEARHADPAQHADEQIELPQRADQRDQREGGPRQDHGDDPP